MKKLLVIGATSVIAQETALCFAKDGAALFLVARNQRQLSVVAENLRRQGAVQVETAAMDALEYDQHDAIVAQAADRLGGLEVALIAHGTLPDQKACEASFEEARRELEINAMTVVSLLTSLSKHFERQRSGTIAVLSSVAGDRGRQSNYIYGTAKGAISIFLQGLRNRLNSSGVKVVTIKLGRVDTPMTAVFEKRFLWAQPVQVGPAIYRAIERGKDVAYVPAYWKGIMMIIKMIPERVFKRLSM